MRKTMTYIGYILVAACLAACVTSGPKNKPKIIWEDLNSDLPRKMAP